MQAQGFPTLGKDLKIINKLNGMAITLSEGWYNTKPGSVISQRADFPQRQNFRIIQKGNSEIYFIEMVHKDLVLSTKSGWGDLVYSEARLDKCNEQTCQMWRIVPYDAVMYNQRTQPKHVFQYVPAVGKSVNFKTNSSPNTGFGYNNAPQKNEFKTQNFSSQPCFQLGYEFDSGNHISHNYQASKVSHPEAIFKLGYQFQSGLHLNYTYEDQKYKQKTSNEQPPNNQNDITYPVRFPIKQKNNTNPIDRDNRGWFFIENVKYNLVLQIEAGIDEPGMSIVLNTMYGNRNQLWKFI